MRRDCLNSEYFAFLTHKELTAVSVSIAASAKFVMKGSYMYF